MTRTFPYASPPTPKIPCTNVACDSMTQPSPGSTSLTTPDAYARTCTGIGLPRTITWPVTPETDSIVPVARE